MHNRGPLVRSLLVLGSLVAAGLAVVGGLALPVEGIVAVLVAGVLVACLAAGAAREDPAVGRMALLEGAVLAGGGAVAVLLVLSGTAILAGGAVAALVAGTMAGAVVLWFARAARTGVDQRTADGWAPGGRESSGSVLHLPSRPASSGRADPAVAEAARTLPPVSTLTTRALGREWLRTGAALAGRLDPPLRQLLVRRRQDALDELERRDPEGFARWLAEGPELGSDPAEYLRDEDPAAGTDAA